jgi:4-amino-4-deoxy-L-arabinose transferase-like glycosyltransferase
MGSRRWPWLLAGALLALFLLTGLRHLDGVPQVYEDEPWQASTAYSLLTRGTFGSELFSGFFNMDQRYYGFMPLHPFLMAATFKLIGVGLGQARVETEVLTALTLILTFALGVRLFNAWVGTLAVGMLVLVRWTGLTYVQLTGMPIVDFARIARYDPLVPVVGLSALHVYVAARKHRRAWLFGLAGALAGLAGLAHVYGLFWVAALLLLAVWDRASSGAVVAIGVGAVLPWLPYAAYVLTDVPDWRGQTLVYAGRFELLNPGWYVSNVVQEFHRYGPGLGPPGLAWLLRPGWWFVLVALPVSLFALARRALACDAAARAIVVPSLLFPLLFAVFITLKLVNYTLIELPLFALAMAWGLHILWQRVARLRPVLAVILAAIVVEGGGSLARLEEAAATLTPYPAYIAEVRQQIPPGSRILGLHSYWLGLQDFSYRSFLVPLNWADLGVPLDQALEQVDPDVVLLDPRMRAYFGSVPDGERFEAWLRRHAAELIGQVDDPTYGLMQVYRLKR